MPVKTETEENENADQREEGGDGHAEHAGLFLRRGRNGDAPLAEKIPDADAEMEGGGENADEHKEEEPRVGEELFDVGVGGTAVGEPALGVEMPGDVDEGDEAGVALRGVEPVPYPWVRG